MSKAPEELAEEWVGRNRSYPYHPERSTDKCVKAAFLAGYQAAQKDAAIEIEHLKGSIEALREVRNLWQQDFETYRRNKNK